MYTRFTVWSGLLFFIYIRLKLYYWSDPSTAFGAFFLLCLILAYILVMLIEKLMTFTYQQFWFGISEKLLSLGIQESGFFWRLFLALRQRGQRVSICKRRHCDALIRRNLNVLESNSTESLSIADKSFTPTASLWFNLVNAINRKQEGLLKQ